VEKSERYAGADSIGNPFSHETVPVGCARFAFAKGSGPGIKPPGNTMIPNALTAARGFVMRKVAGRFDACRQLVSTGGGVCVSHPSLLATAGVFVLMLMPILLALVAIGVALHLPGHSALHFAEVIPVTGAVAIRELKEKKATALTAARSVHDAAERENRSMSAEETTRYTAFMADVRSLSERITRSEALLEEERALAGNNPNPVTPPTPGDPNQRTNPRATPEYRSAFNRFLQVGRNALNGEEHRALSAGIDAEGGYTIAPEQFVNELIRQVDNLVILRSAGHEAPVPTPPRSACRRSTRIRMTSTGRPSSRPAPKIRRWRSRSGR
jgi:hypothetical protein